MLKIENLTKIFGHKKILNGINLSVRKGEIAVLLGQSGTGKSTLLRTLNNLEKPDAGTIELNGKTLDLAHVAKEHTIGMVFQHFNLFEHLTVEENITLALEKVVGKTHQEAIIIAADLLKHYGLADKGDLYVSELSGGQKQRLALARTLALKPQVICLDEPTSALDPLLTTHVANTIQDLAAQGYIVLVASHDVGLLEKLDCTIYLMANGSIIESVESTAFKHNKAKYPMLSKFISGDIE
ncbi:MAG: ATP-binding cassette domain-containing protein [Candidatus Babeliales bacterium]|nr:ATP-binding cassette domain-containing protein [Candidatus Babeliales bacterium]